MAACCWRALIHGNERGSVQSCFQLVQSTGGFLEVRGNDSMTLFEQRAGAARRRQLPGHVAAEQFNPQTGLSTNIGLLNLSRLTHSGTLLTNGEVLAGGGIKLAARSSPALRYTSLPRALFAAPARCGRRAADHTATRLLDGRVLVIGGEDVNGTPLASAELFDPGTNEFPPVHLRAGREFTRRECRHQSARVSGASLEIPCCDRGRGLRREWTHRRAVERLWARYGPADFFAGRHEPDRAVPIYPDRYYEPDETELLALDPNSVSNAIVGRGRLSAPFSMMNLFPCLTWPTRPSPKATGD
jgi:hypothetical protein